MPLRSLSVALFLGGCALSLQADSATGWIPDRAHPDVQYRLKCTQGALNIDWRSAYPGAVTLKVSVRGSGYDGEEQVVIPPGASANSDVDTLGCYAPAIQITEKKFSMAPPPPPAVPAKSSDPAKAPAPVVPTVAPWIPPAHLAELAPEAIASIHVGMNQQDVVRTIGNPVSKLSIPEENELVESYRYPVLSGRVVIIRFSNGLVTEVAVPQP
jgi:hypothetical protein